ncbi:MAG: LLM class F420-dependent oxidoreductase [Gammaproteobacteria bacterium]|jgi:F420-dependent oxidoreductase-like protein|nr:LLM class F420-dependent oxidoreductase [Gammaproteobacteria bacterium]MBT4494187.1 LLM class F420-dependent oxidoreductase [Gammaproteobacteria bacterium]MBT7372146.1 LLM class F420-dependent oxidoreductase [Gammaproteobacteria bacterium]
MKLGLSLGYSGGQLQLPVEKVQLAERLGYDSVWTAEAYGSDALSPLAYLAAKTERIRLGTAVIQLAGRTPANAAMTIATIDALAGGNRVICGIGVSGPQIVEGWYGQPWGKPYYRIKDYVSIMKKVLRREEPVVHEGKEITLPYTGPGAMGIGKPLKSILHTNPDIPIWLGTGMESTVKLTAEIADGWLPLGLVPENYDSYEPWIEAGLEKAGKDRSDFESFSGTSVTVTDDVQSALDRLKPGIALYVGGMGHKTKNFHNEMMVRRGFGDAAQRIQELFLAKRKEEATAAVPDEFVDQGALIGDKQRIKKRFKDWEDCGLTGMTISADEDGLRLMAEIARLNVEPGA